MKPLLLFMVLLPAVTGVFMVVMSAVMPPVFRHPEPLVQSSAGNENSLAAMLVGLVFAMAAFLTGFGWLIVRGLRDRGQSTDPDATASDSGVARGASRPPSPAPQSKPAGEPAAPWERPADWWKSTDG